MIVKGPHADVEIPDVSLGGLVLESLSAYDDKPALIGGVTDRTITYRQLAGANRKDPRVKQEVFSRMPPDKIVDLAQRFGPYGFCRGDASGQALSLHKRKQAPHGIYLGPLQPCFPERLVTWSRRIELAPEVPVGDLARLERKLLDEATVNGANDPLLIGLRQRRCNNSWMHNSPWLVRCADRCTLLMCPRDAAARGPRARRCAFARDWDSWSCRWRPATTFRAGR